MHMHACTFLVALGSLALGDPQKLARLLVAAGLDACHAMPWSIKQEEGNVAS